MRKLKSYYVAAAGAVILALIATVAGQMTTPAPARPAEAAADWALNATIIEACSCPMFCQCYFNDKPAAHAGHDGHAAHGGAGQHFCRFNNAFRVNKGHAGGVKLDGAKFWVAGDLGGDFSKGQMDWAVLTFDPAVSKEQRAAIANALGHLYPVKWNSFSVAQDAEMEWAADAQRAVARLAGGKVAEVILRRPGSAMGTGPVVIQNLRYWGAPRNEGFVMMPNEVEAYRAGERPFEFKGTNGFMITIDITSRDVKGE
jgi:hypothetical protein